MTVNKSHNINKDKTAALILGMHRSGTSMLAGIIDFLGCASPRTLMAGNNPNPKGYFESNKVKVLNDEILAYAGVSWSDWIPLNEGWAHSPCFNDFIERASQIIISEYENASLLYLKDPRICRTLPIWINAFESLGYRLVCIHTHRHPEDVAKSLQNRKNITVEFSLGLLCWIRYNLESEFLSRGLDRIFTSYSESLENWKRIIVKSEKLFGFPFPENNKSTHEKISKFVDENLRHYNSHASSLINNIRIQSNLKETLCILHKWSVSGEDREDYAKLDELRRSLDASSPLLQEMASSSPKSVDRVKGASNENSTL